jgi:RHS repeat-associated protein
VGWSTLKEVCSVATVTLVALMVATAADASFAPTRLRSQEIASLTDCTQQPTDESEEAAASLISSRLPPEAVRQPTKSRLSSRFVNDQLQSVTDPRGISTTYTQNGFGETIKLASQDSGITTKKYDAAGNAASITDARNVTIDQRFDALNRLLSAAYKPTTGPNANVTQETIAYVYGDSTNPADATVIAQTTNAKGRLAQLKDGSGSTRYRYDPHGRVTEKTQSVKGSASNEIVHTQSYRYNAAGQLDQITTPSGQTIGYGYSNNQIVSVTVNGTPVLSDTLYFPFGGIKQWKWASATANAASNLYERKYDADGRITSVTLGNQTRSYAYDDASRIITVSEANPATPNTATRSTTVDYDNLDRLTAETQKLNPATVNTEAYKRGYSYDAVGNRLTKTTSENAAANQSTAYTAAANSNRLATVASVTQQHDANGNLINDGTYGFVYSARNRLSLVNTSNDASNTNPNATSVIAQYQHNGFGERVWKRTTGNGPNSPANDERYFVYDESGHLSGEYGPSGLLIQETVWLDDTPVATLRKPATATTAASIANSAIVYRIWSDHLDTPRTITSINASDNAANQAVWSWDSDAFGNTLPATTSGNLNVSTLEYNLRFPGQYFDTETGLHYNYFRDYSPNTGRYAQSDPIGLAGGYNTYAYVDSDPLTSFDSDGFAKQRRPAWKKDTDNQLNQRSGGKCEDCGDKFGKRGSGKGKEKHHTEERAPIRDGIDAAFCNLPDGWKKNYKGRVYNDPDYLRLLCEDCHDKRHGKGLRYGSKSIGDVYGKVGKK